LRVPTLALRAARAVAALNGATAILPDHAKAAVRLVYSWRALQMPQPPQDTEANPEENAGEDGQSRQDADQGEADRAPSPEDYTEILLQAVATRLPAGLLGQVPAQRRLRGSGPSGRSGPIRYAMDRGRSAGTLEGRPVDGKRLDLLATLRQAAPWQRLRRSQRQARQRGLLRASSRADASLIVEPGDLRIKRFKQHAATVTLFVVDASGSAALQRLAEAKGAVEQLLADCYVRRDEVAMIAFRGRGAELVLPPTRSLVRAKRALAHVPGGGGTPLAAGLQLAGRLARQIEQRGAVPLVVLLTDGRANVALDGRGGRQNAEEDSCTMARELQAKLVPVAVVDTSVRGQPFARRLAELMDGPYVTLPYADHNAVSGAVRNLLGQGAGRG
jgi:magnesium chelatase subunit D